MKLTTPTDFDILETMRDRKRQTPANLADQLSLSNTYASNRVQHLLDHQLIKRVNPNIRRGGMYVIADKGIIAVEHRAEYDQELRREFGECVERILDIQDALTEFDPDAICPNSTEMDVLESVESGPFTYPEDPRSEGGAIPLLKAYYRLSVFRLVSRDEFTFEITDRGQVALDFWNGETSEWSQENCVQLTERVKANET